MLRRVLVVLMLCALVPVAAWGQGEAPPPPEPTSPPPPPESAPPPPPAAEEQPITLSGQQAAKAERYSRFSAGPGGAFLIFSEVIAGLVTGGLVGGSYVSTPGRNIGQGVYFGALTGALLLGGAATAYQYYVPVGRVTAGLATLGAGVGFMAGWGIGDLARLTTNPQAWFWLVAATTQLGVILPLAFTYGLEDISGEDLGLIGMTTVYAFVVTALGTMMAAPSNGVPAWPLLISPAVGMALGGLFASMTEMKPGRVLKLTALPLGVGLILFYLGGLTGDLTLVAATTLVGIAVTFGLTFIFTSEEPEPARPATARADESILDRMVMTPVLLPAGRRGESIAAGPGVAFAF